MLLGENYPGRPNDLANILTSLSITLLRLCVTFRSALVYINDLSKVIDSEVRIFADDTVVYREIEREEDRLILSNDLNKIAKWCDDWHLELNVDKCSVINFFEGKSIAKDYSYSLQGKNLITVES
ncbi:hypothetical protein, partial [Microcystis aeruginosa]|uniref:hypothetical protein n=1 Tax=Microcystis aeruginosa TaxID=1126 RepID=UPI001C406479